MDNSVLLADHSSKENCAVQPLPRVRQRFLNGVAQVTNDPDMWNLMPGTTDHSVWKMVLQGKVCSEIRDDAHKAHAILCSKAANSETVSRQLHYWGFKNLNKRVVHMAKIEVAPGRFVTARYAEFTHVPKPGHEHGLWSNARGFPSPDHHRVTRHDVVPTNRSKACCKRKRDGDADNLSDELLQTLTATYDAELDKQEESMDCILRTLELDADTCNFSAEMVAVFEEWLDF